MHGFGALLLADYLTLVPDEHEGCGADHFLTPLATSWGRTLRRWCAPGPGGGAAAAYGAAWFLIECIQELEDHVGQIMADVRADVSTWPAAVSA
jgi:hypothetical protein